MLTNRFRTAGIAARLVALAVLFSPIIHGDDDLTGLETKLSQLVYKISPTVVTVQADFTSPSSTSSPYLGRELVRSLISSGIIVDSSGHIVLAASSVAGSQAVYVHLPSRKIVAARLVGIDYPSGLALLGSQMPVGPPAEIAPQYLCGGQMVLAVGNSHGVRVSPSLGFCAGVRDDGLIQFSGLITAGTIGGGLFDLSGRLVGLISGGLGEDGRIEAGLAVPAGRISEIVNYLKRHGDRLAGYIGLTMREIEINPGISPGPRADVTLVASDDLITHGLLVTGVERGSPAALTGLRAGDLIFTFDGKEIYSAVEQKREIQHFQPGRHLVIEFLRENKSYAVTVPVAGRCLLANGESAIVSGDEDHDELAGEVLKLKESLRYLESKLNSGR